MKIALVVLVCLVQLAVPASIIYSYEDTLSKGTEYRFKVRPVDPADPFRGRYVRLGFDEENTRDRVIPMPGIESIPKKQRFAFASIAVGEDGLAKVVAVTGAPPQSGDYIKVKTTVYSNKLYRINFPFDRYYAEESKAPNIENVVFNTRNLGEERLITAQVFINQGRGVISELYVDGQTIHDFLDEK
ncbi:hypothetical protein NBRC116583_08040 [Arenicella sp. 4NH20-0111]|uniref:GDYXXLXY domain-containing protein n=1 Tax=Arenicella sp. 4NH20-0111 TaxID=3127648 RepID=UPI0031072DA2